MFLFLFVFLVVKTQVITASSFLKVIVLVNNRYLEQLVILMMGCLCFTVNRFYASLSDAKFRSLLL